MMEPAHAGTSAPRAYLRLGGATLARHQLALALAAGCEKVVCLARALEPDLIELQHITERSGARFHMIGGSRALGGQVAAQDEVLVLADGLVPAPGDALELLGQGPVILDLPADSAVPAGFERIDLNQAWAGLMMVPGRLVDRLNELPADAEPASALLRIALQAGVAQRLVPQNVANSGRWMLVRTEDEAHSAEQRWMDRHTDGDDGSFGHKIAGWNVRRFGPALLHAGSGGRAFGISLLVSLLIAVTAAWFGFGAAGLALLAPSVLMQQSAEIIEKIQSDALGTKTSLWGKAELWTALLDLVLCGVLFLAVAPLPGEPVWHRLFPPVMLVGLLRLAGKALPSRWSNWLSDRMLAALLLGGLAALGTLPVAVPAICVLLLAGILISGPLGITRA